MLHNSRLAFAALLALALSLLGGCANINSDDGGVSLDRSITLLQVQATSSDPATRANCVEALESWRDPRATAVIEQGLHDKDWVVRFAAAMAVGKRKDAPYKPTLLDMVAKDPNNSVKAAAIYALRQMGDTANMSALAGFLESPDPSVRANTAFALGLMGDKSAIPLLESAGREADPRVKFEITAALARLGSKNAQRVIISLAFSKYAEDQWMAMTICPELPPEIAADPLLLGLSEPKDLPANLRELTTRRQLVAARSLAKMHSAEGAKVAFDNLSNPNPSLRALAAFATGEMLAPQQIGGISPLLSDPDPNVQRAAAAAIVNIYARHKKG